MSRSNSENSSGGSLNKTQRPSTEDPPEDPLGSQKALRKVRYGAKHQTDDL